MAEAARKVGDICLITEENSSRPTWPLRKIEAIPEKNGLIRKFKLKTKSGLLTRSTQCLNLLESNEETTLARDFSYLTAPSERSQGGEDVARDDTHRSTIAPGCEVPSRRQTVKPPVWHKDYCMF